MDFFSKCNQVRSFLTRKIPNTDTYHAVEDTRMTSVEVNEVPMFYFYSPYTQGFPKFLGVIEMEFQAKMG